MSSRRDPAEGSDKVRPGLAATLVSRPIGLFVAFVTLLLVGAIAYVDIPLQLLPSGLQGSSLTVWVNHPGSSAAENEEKVARVLEEQFRTIPQLDNLSSRSGEGSVYLRVGFNGNADLKLAKAELRDRIERARPQLPDTVDRINVWSYSNGDPPIMFFALLVEERTADMDWLVEEHVQRKLEAVEGISRVQVWGMLDDSIRILLDEDQVRASRLDLGGLIRRLGADNFAEPLGELTDGGRRFLVRSDMRFRSFEDIENYPIGNGLRLSDVASIERVKTVRDRLTRIDGKDAYYGMVQKESTANVVEAAEGLHAAIAALDEDPKVAGRVKLEVFFDQASFIRTSLDQLESTAIWGGGLAVLVLLAFLRRARMTFCVALSIPTSAILAIAYEYFTGGSFNVLTMTGLTLGIGMLVDNSVVVIESIARVAGQGQRPKAAAILGIRDVGLAISMATMTSVVVFLPLIFMGENPTMSVMLGALGIPLCASLLFSLLVALVFLPVASARILGGRPASVDRLLRPLVPISQVPVHLLSWVVAGIRYAFHLARAAAHRVERAALGVLSPIRWPLGLAIIGAGIWLFLPRREELTGARQTLRGLAIPDAGLQMTSGALSGTLFLAVAGALLAILGVGRWRARQVAPPARPERFRPKGNSILGWIQDGNRALLAWTLEHRFLASFIAALVISTVVIPQSRMTMTAFGRDEDTTEVAIRVDLEDNFTLFETSQEFERYEEILEDRYRPTLGFAHIVSRFGPGGGEIELRWKERQSPEFMTAAREQLREGLPRFPGHRVLFGREQELDVATRQYVNFQLRGPNANALERHGLEAIEILERVPGLYDVTSSLEDAPEQVRLMMDKDTAYSYGVTSDVALQSLSWALRGAALPRYQEAGREVPLIIEYDESEVAGLDTVKDLEVFTPQGPVPLAAFARIEFQRGARQIFRWNGQTTFNIQARIEDPSRQGELVEAGYLALEGLDLPRGFSLGRDDSALARQQAEMTELRNALLLSVVLVFLLMGILFESITLPAAVMTTIPFAVVGALWTLYVTGTVMDSVGWIGVIILVGVVVNNGIVLVDKIHRTRVEGGKTRTEAVLEGASARVRPILMTALTTVFGLLPMATGDAPTQGIDYRALATCVAGGLAASTFFTLWIVPLAYTLVDDLDAGRRKLLQRVLGRGPRPGLDSPGSSGARPLPLDRQNP